MILVLNLQAQDILVCSVGCIGPDVHLADIDDGIKGGVISQSLIKDLSSDVHTLLDGQ